MEAFIEDGIVMISQPHDDFNEERYLKARSLEGRVLTNNQVSKLPFTTTVHSHHNEWKLRAKSYKRLLSVIKKRKPVTLLDIGCGNGWLIGNLGKEFSNCEFTGVDLNRIELKQASQLFGNDNTRFCYFDLINNTFFDNESFEVIIFNASIQYFDDLSTIIKIAKSLLKPNGLLLINDSPLYNNSNESKEAKQRSKAYYKQLGVPEMANNYFHHTVDELTELGFAKYQNWTALVPKYPFPLYIYSKP